MNLKELKKRFLKLQNKIYSPITVNDVTVDIIEVDFEDPAGAVYCPPHTHTWFEFNYVTSGYFFTKFDTEMLKVEENMFFLIPPGVEHSHSYVAHNPHNGFLLRWNFKRNESAIDMDTPTFGFNQLEKLHSWKCGCYKDDGIIGNLLEQMLKHAEFEASAINLQLDFLNILFMLSNLASPDLEEWRYDRNVSAKALLRKVDTYLNDVTQEPFDVYALAASLHMSYGNLARVYKKHSGQTIQNRRSTILVEKSLLLLEQTDCSISEIAEKLGFSNQYYFSRVFKEKKGVSPSEYRNLFKNEGGAIK
jgi:AraC-like DNA-binding protein/quercetin dioxygenase-like cupin family protein